MEGTPPKGRPTSWLDPDDEEPRRSAEEILAGAQAKLPARYRVLSIIGAGGMGVVVRAFDDRLGRDVAIKLLHEEEDRRRLRLLREARAGANLAHPGIVTVHDVAPAGDYIVMELIRGESLDARISREKRLPMPEVRRIAHELLDALSAAHRAGIVHRDVKPGNVLLDESGAVKLADFGVASFGTRDLTRTGVSIGTPGYMAPEQLRGRQAGPPADVYAAGVTLFEAATGQNLHGRSKLPAAPHDLLLAATGDAAFAAAIDRALREDPDERFPDASAFAAALHRADGAAESVFAGSAFRLPSPSDSSIAPQPEPPQPTALRGPGRAWTRVLLPVAAVLLAFVGFKIVRGRESVGGSGRVVVAVLPFVDGSGDRRLDFARAGLPQILVAELDDIPGLSVVGYYDLLDRVPDPGAPEAAWTDAARSLGAGIILRGDLSPGRNGVRVEIRAGNASGAPLAAEEKDVPIDDVPSATRSLAREVVVAALGLPDSRPATSAWDFDADRNLQIGIAALELHDLETADRHLRLAADLAPTQAEPHYYLAIVDWWLSRDPKTDIDLALAGELSTAQRGFLRGLSLLWDQSHLEAIPHFEALVEEHPRDREILYGLFEAYFHAARPTDAMRIYRRLCEHNPRFDLGLDHAVSYYVAHGDEEGMAWALARLADAHSPDEDLWRIRVSVSRREPEAAVSALTRLLSRAGERNDDYRRELMQVYALSGQTTLAVDLGSRLSRPDPIAELALRIARGRKDLEANARLAVSAAEVATQKEAQEHGWGELTAVLATSPSLMAGRVRPAADSFTRDRHDRLPATFAAALSGDRATVEKLRASDYPDVEAVAEAFSADWRGDWAASAASWRRAVSATTDGPFLLAEWYYMARARRAANDLAGTLEACEEVLAPRRFAWSWAGAVGPCLIWSAEAEAKLGRPDRAKELQDRLIGVRSEAPPDDALLQAARED